MSFKLLMDLHDKSIKQGVTEEYIDALEEFLNECNQAEAQGVELVDDSVYDTVKSWLMDVAPDSEVLRHTWSEDESGLTDYDVYQAKFPMMSIQTIKDLHCKEVRDFGEKIPDTGINLLVSMKLNGHGVRVVFKDGVLVKAHTRGRSSNGRDITRHMKIVIGDIPALDGYGLVEVRGEVLLPLDRLSAALQFNSSIKSAFTGVSSLIKDSATDDEISLLSFVAYNIFTDSIEFNTLGQKFSFLKSCGFTIPLAAAIPLTDGNTIEDDLAEIVSIFEQKVVDYNYYTDGLVVAVDNLEEFTSFGSADSHHLGNLALKVGYWEQNMYSAVIEGIKWKRGKNKFSPVAVIEPTLTATGNTVQNVPLYNPYNILYLNAYPGSVIHFRYGGEAGVKPCTPDGKDITDVG